ncbi:hypothetical protein M9H77_12698 [Catharanthus roseus]|uniref:Uncharacterized protein n=1 Tax=Catharanthus roseus TaxID=4058 RepID=A0ACC0BI35_CATRO|nr:hypothetical protein M9H77_12698 [Catharanthus roseus]
MKKMLKNMKKGLGMTIPSLFLPLPLATCHYSPVVPTGDHKETLPAFTDRNYHSLFVLWQTSLSAALSHCCRYIGVIVLVVERLSTHFEDLVSFHTFDRVKLWRRIIVRYIEELCLRLWGLAYNSRVMVSVCKVKEQKVLSNYYNWAAYGEPSWGYRPIIGKSSVTRNVERNIYHVCCIGKRMPKYVNEVYNIIEDVFSKFNRSLSESYSLEIHERDRIGDEDDNNEDEEEVEWESNDEEEEKEEEFQLESNFETHVCSVIGLYSFGDVCFSGYDIYTSCDLESISTVAYLSPLPISTPSSSSSAARTSSRPALSSSASAPAPPVYGVVDSRIFILPTADRSLFFLNICTASTSNRLVQSRLLKSSRNTLLRLIQVLRRSRTDKEYVKRYRWDPLHKCAIWDAWEKRGLTMLQGLDSWAKRIDAQKVVFKDAFMPEMEERGNSSTTTHLWLINSPFICEGKKLAITVSSNGHFFYGKNTNLITDSKKWMSDFLEE